MPDVTSHKPGMFCWTDLNTPDPAKSKAFYSELFGWTFEDQPIEGGGTYTLARKRGRDVAAITGMKPDAEQRGITPHWNVHFAVASADAAADRVAKAGGQVLAKPFDVMKVGRMAVLRDPAGGTFAVWQARSHIGASVIGEHGAITWAELASRDPKACVPFYEKVFGWRGETVPMEGMQYTVFQGEGQPAAGMMPMPPHLPAGVPSHWTPYFSVDDCDATVARAQKLGVRMAVPPTDIPNIGRFAMFFDPQGAGLAVITPKR